VHNTITPTVSEIYDYDTLDRTTKITTCSTPVRTSLCGSSKYFYDENDNLESIFYPSGLKVNYEYNSVNQVDRVYNFYDSEINNIFYYYGSDHRAGLLRQYRRLNGDVVNFDYNGRRKPGRIQSDAVILAYYYDSRGNQTRYVRSGWAANATYGYDELNRIRTFNGPWGSGEYYYGYGSDNRVLKSIRSSQSPWNYTIKYVYDTSKNSIDYFTKSYPGGSNPPVDISFENGNMTAMGNKSFIYDQFHMVKEVKINDNKIAEYGYNANNIRAYKKYNDNPGDITLYYRDSSGKILSELNAHGSAIFDYIYLNNRLIAKVKGFKPPAPNHGPVIAPVIFLLRGH